MKKQIPFVPRAGLDPVSLVPIQFCSHLKYFISLQEWHLRRYQYCNSCKKKRKYFCLHCTEPLTGTLWLSGIVAVNSALLWNIRMQAHLISGIRSHLLRNSAIRTEKLKTLSDVVPERVPASVPPQETEKHSNIQNVTKIHKCEEMSCCFHYLTQDFQVQGGSVSTLE